MKAGQVKPTGGPAQVSRPAFFLRLSPQAQPLCDAATLKLHWAKKAFFSSAGRLDFSRQQQQMACSDAVYRAALVCEVSARYVS
jgi:hypothetical protein